jgi:hypothetical protein
MKTVNETMGETIDEKDSMNTELNHLIYAAATVITEEIYGMGEYILKKINNTPVG